MSDNIQIKVLAKLNNLSLDQETQGKKTFYLYLFFTLELKLLEWSKNLPPEIWEAILSFLSRAQLDICMLVKGTVSTVTFLRPSADF